MTRFLDAVAGYDPGGFEPKDAARQSWVEAKVRILSLPALSADLVVNILLFLLVVIVWLALVPPGASRRR